MIYSDDTLYLINLINESLKMADCSFNLQNKDIFTLNEYYHAENYLRYDFIHDEKVKISLWLEDGDLRIDLDKVEEAFEWTKDALRESPENLHEIIKIIFCSTIKIKTRCSNHIKILFLDNENSILESLNYTFGFLLLCYYWICPEKEETYHPICLSCPTVPTANPTKK